MSVTTTSTQRALLERFAGMVAASPHNLVSRSARDQLLDRHVPECMVFAHLLPTGPARVLDIGSGGGFPGMIVAILRPDLEVHLLDATRKKTAFLAGAAEELGVRVTVHTGRAEELAKGRLGGSFDVVTARAVAAVDRLIPWSVPFLRAGGLVYALKGERWRDEVDAAATTLQRWRVEIAATPEEVVAGGEGPGTAPTEPKVLVLRAP
jgi:16S rRNA (guanine527-N7)-methyltransferase